MTRDLEGKSALVTGGASGIGQATALAFAREGARVAVADIMQDAAQRTVNEIKAMGGQAIPHFGDAADWNDSKAMFDLAVREFGGHERTLNDRNVALWVIKLGDSCDFTERGCVSSVFRKQPRKHALEAADACRRGWITHDLLL
jgi:NAD(P)-dependent dehydrogenase (short-subunit alcohol dehydrogenase family)